MQIVSQWARSARSTASLMVLIGVACASTGAATFIVDTTADTVAVNPSVSPLDSAGHISLRSAIMAANAQAGVDIIELQSAATYKLTLVPPAGDTDIHNPSNGDLDITAPLTINGHGSVVDAGGIDRVFAIENVDDTNFSVDLNGLTITGGSPKGFQRAGGGISVRAATLSLNNCLVKGNSTSATTSPSNGGGIAANGVGVPTVVPATLVLTSCTVSGNSANNGGGIAVGSCNLTLIGTAINNNTATGTDSGSGGGGVFLAGDTTVATIKDDSLIQGNTGSADGGGISVLAATLNLINSTVEANKSSLNGGGIYSSPISPGTLTLSGSTVSGNTADSLSMGLGNGGGISSTGSCTLTNCTISGNTASSGGGIAGGATLASATITANSATRGGGLYPNGGTVSMLNTILAGNSALVTSNGPDGFGSVTSQGYNLLGSMSGLTISGVLTGNIVSTSPLMGPLTYNGGITFTHALIAGSPAIDAGSPTGFPAVDQRGVVRPQDGNLTGSPRCDIGAYEYVAPYAIVDTARALRIAGGLLKATASDINRLDLVASDGRITLADAARAARKATGLDANP